MRRTWRWGTASGESLCPSVVIAPAFRQFHCCEVTTDRYWIVVCWKQLCVYFEEGTDTSQNPFFPEVPCQIKGVYIHRSIDSYNTYIYLYKRYWYFHIYMPLPLTTFAGRCNQSRSVTGFGVFYERFCLSMLSLHTVNSSLVGIVSSYRQFCVSSWAPQVFARPMPAESMAERAREVWYSRKIGIFVSIINHIYI